MFHISFIFFIFQVNLQVISLDDVLGSKVLVRNISFIPPMTKLFAAPKLGYPLTPVQVCCRYGTSALCHTYMRWSR